MLKYLKKIFSNDTSENREINRTRKLQISTCALFIEMAKADSNFSNEEEEKIISIMKSLFELDDEYVNELIETAKERTEESISLYEFTTILNEQFTNDEKYDVIKNMWRLIFTDNKLDKYEDQLVKRIGGMLNLDFNLIIAAKLEVKKEIENQN